MMPNVTRSHGGTVIIESGPGVGRSRLLDAFMLEGKLGGAQVISATAEDAYRGDYGVVKALLEDMISTRTDDISLESLKNVDVLHHIIPSLYSARENTTSCRPIEQQQHRAEIQSALITFFMDYCIKKRLMMAIDDLEHCDEPSLAVLAALSQKAHQIKLVIVVTVLIETYAKAVEDQLLIDSGIVHWENMDERLEPSAKVQLCIKKAQERWLSLQEHERGIDPLTAVGELIKYTFIIGGTVLPTCNMELISRMEQILSHFITISKTAELTHGILECGTLQINGRSCAEIRLEIQERYSTPLPDLDEGLRNILINYINPYYIALTEASNGNLSGLERANQLEEAPRFRPHAWQVRLVSYLFTGESQQAEACQKHKEVLAVQNPQSDVHLVSGLLFETWAYIMYGDLMGLKKLLPTVTNKAELYPGWVPIMLSVRGSYHYLRGELSQAKQDLEKMMELAPIGHHLAWQLGLPTLVVTLLEMKEYDNAYQLASDSLEKILDTTAPIGSINEINRVLALVEAKKGLHKEAFMRIEKTIEKARSEKIDGIPLGLLYETGSWIAIEAKDENAFNSYAEATAKLYRSGQSPALYAKLQRLFEESKKYDMLRKSRKALDLAAFVLAPSFGVALLRLGRSLWTRWLYTSTFCDFITPTSLVLRLAAFFASIELGYDISKPDRDP